jgi:hypothetical protein
MNAQIGSTIDEYSVRSICKGKANASHHRVFYFKKERPDVAARIIADVRVDIDHLDDEQVFRYAQRYDDDAPPREQWGSN